MALAPSSRVGHGLSFPESVAQAQSDEAPAQAVAVDIEIFSEGLGFPNAGGENVTDGKIQDQFPLGHFFSQTQVRKGHTGDLALNVSERRPMVPNNLELELSR